jgi:hypothetical protein
MWKPSADLQTKLERCVSEILFYVWDPIGVNGMAACRDEYDGYVPLIVAYLRRNRNEFSLNAVMMHLVQNEIGYGNYKAPRRTHQHREALRALLEWQQDLKEEILASQDLAPPFPEDEDFGTQVDWSRDQARQAAA